MKHSTVPHSKVRFFLSWADIRETPNDKYLGKGFIVTKVMRTFQVNFFVVKAPVT